MSTQPLNWIWSDWNVPALIPGDQYNAPTAATANTCSWYVPCHLPLRPIILITGTHSVNQLLVGLQSLKRLHGLPKLHWANVSQLAHLIDVNTKISSSLNSWDNYAQLCGGLDSSYFPSNITLPVETAIPYWAITDRRYRTTPDKLIN